MSIGTIIIWSVIGLGLGKLISKWGFKDKKTWVAVVVAAFAVILFGGGNGGSSSGSASIDVSSSLERKFSNALSEYYEGFKEIVSIEKLDEDASFDYKFTIIKRNGGVSCKQNGFLRCYDDGTVYDVVSRGDPYDFTDSKGNPIHDKSGYDLY